VTTLRELTADLPSATRDALCALTRLYGGLEVLEQAKALLPGHALIRAALADLAWLHGHLEAVHPEVKLGLDLADLTGYAYYSGVRFGVYAAGSPDAILRGGRYDEVGAVFGRRRPAVGFSLDLKAIVSLGAQTPFAAAVRAPWGEDATLRAAVRDLRQQGHTVVCVLPGHEHEGDEFECDRELVRGGSGWELRPL
jgi:ATP phosphoribosyltransferase regulatory subunit